jgi:Carbamoyltransferase, Kae1-like Domain, second subdomain
MCASVAVEFVHPVIVGKRALPALGLTDAGELAQIAEPADIVLAFGRGAPFEDLRRRGCLTVAFTSGAASSGRSFRRARTRSSARSWSRRPGALWPVRLPGGAAAIREPWRMAFAWLAEAFGEPQPPARLLRAAVEGRRWAAMVDIIASADVVATDDQHGPAVRRGGGNVRPGARASYKGQAAIELEAAAALATDCGSCPTELITGGPGLTFDLRHALRAAVADVESEVPVPIVASRFHAGVADVTARACTALATARGLNAVVLSGGVFQNRRLLESVGAALRGNRLRVLTPQALPPTTAKSPSARRLLRRPEHGPKAAPERGDSRGDAGRLGLASGPQAVVREDRRPWGPSAHRCLSGGRSLVRAGYRQSAKPL